MALALTIQDSPAIPSLGLACRRVWSLFDLTRYAIRDLHALLVWMDHTARWTLSQENYRTGSQAVLTKTEIGPVQTQVTCLKKHCVALELQDTARACDIILDATKERMTLGECLGHLISIRRTIEAALLDRVFMYVPLNVAKYAKAYQEPTPPILAGVGRTAASEIPQRDALVKPFGDTVFNVFPTARYDSEQVALCLIAGASTAAVFHMMRVIECGVRSLGKELGITKMKEVPKSSVAAGATGSHSHPPSKRAKPKYRLIPIEYLPWEKLHNQLRSRADSKLNKLRSGPAKDKKQSFYGSVFHDFHGFREAWRNHVMHTRENFDEPEAIRVLAHVERFMIAIAEKTG
ncbi:MAG: hypothetical protein ABSB35_26720 [Bryobacteraceae bacterium]